VNGSARLQTTGLSERETSAAQPLADQLDDIGLVCLPDAVSSDWLAEARRAVTDHIAEHGERDFFVFGPGEDESPLVESLFAQPGLRGLLQSVAAQRFSGLEPRPVRSCLRVLVKQPRRDAPLLHFDNDLVTMVVPILIPTGEPRRCGELIAFPNARPFRRYVVGDIADKVRKHNPWARKRAVATAFARPDRHLVDLQPGNAYLFWGYRTYHGNMPLAPGLIRATLILHYGEPHPSGSLEQLMQRRRRRRINSWLREHHCEPAPH
jgi:hypothetical protein